MLRSSFEGKKTAKDRTHIVRNDKSLRVAFSWEYLVIVHFKVYCVVLSELVNSNSKKSCSSIVIGLCLDRFFASTAKSCI